MVEPNFVRHVMAFDNSSMDISDFVRVVTSSGFEIGNCASKMVQSGQFSANFNGRQMNLASIFVGSLGFHQQASLRQIIDRARVLYGMRLCHHIAPLLMCPRHHGQSFDKCQVFAIDPIEVDGLPRIFLINGNGLHGLCGRPDRIYGENVQFVFECDPRSAH
jgi:hypothetical protein